MLRGEANIRYISLKKPT